MSSSLSSPGIRPAPVRRSVVVQADVERSFSALPARGGSISAACTCTSGNGSRSFADHCSKTSRATAASVASIARAKIPHASIGLTHALHGIEPRNVSLRSRIGDRPVRCRNDALLDRPEAGALGRERQKPRMI